MKYQFWRTNSDAILSVQLLQQSEVAELRWNGASQLVRGEKPERATMNECDERQD